MNIVENEIPYLLEAKTCGCKERRPGVSYRFIESSHGLCLEKGELMLAQNQAVERLLKYAKDEGEIDVLKDETTRLKLALDLMRY